MQLNREVRWATTGRVWILRAHKSYTLSMSTRTL